MTDTVVDANATVNEIPGLECAKFLPSDRCDRCGARAYVRAHFVNGILKFCGHHFRDHREALELKSAKIENGVPQLEWEEEQFQSGGSIDEVSDNKQGRFGFGKNSK